MEEEVSRPVPKSVDLAMEGRSPWLEARGYIPPVFGEQPKEQTERRGAEVQPQPEREAVPAVTPHQDLSASEAHEQNKLVKEGFTSSFKKRFLTPVLGLASTASLSASALTFKFAIDYSEGQVFEALRSGALNDSLLLLATGVVAGGLAVYRHRKNQSSSV